MIIHNIWKNEKCSKPPTSFSVILNLSVISSQFYCWPIVVEWNPLFRPTFGRRNHSTISLSLVVKSPSHMSIPSGWWLTYPSEKYDFVSWDDDLPMESHKIPWFQTTNQPFLLIPWQYSCVSAAWFQIACLTALNQLIQKILFLLGLPLLGDIPHFQIPSGKVTYITMENHHF